MKITVKILQGQETTLEVSDQTSVKDLKQHVFQTLKVPVNQQKLLLTGKPLSAKAERTFSTLRRLKTWIRRRMTEDRLTGLALLHVHRDIEVCPDKVINRFGGQKTRKLDFIS